MSTFPEGDSFVDRRVNRDPNAPGSERRQFANSHDELTEDAREIATAIDGYKLQHRRRFITYEEMLSIVRGLGYEKTAVTAETT